MIGARKGEKCKPTQSFTHQSDEFNCPTRLQSANKAVSRAASDASRMRGKSRVEKSIIAQS